MGRGRAPCCDKSKVRTGPWSPAEDLRLMNFIQNNGHSNWRALPKQAGLLRCGKSCRLRWINYLRPDVKRGNFTPEEENTIIQLHNSIGNKWSKIASCLPGRTDNEIKNVWNTHLKKRVALNHSIPKMDCSSTSTSTSSSSSSSSDEKHMHAAHDSPSPSSSATTDNPKHATNPMESEFDLDFWEGLDSLGADEENGGEVGKWLRMLENELGVANNDGDGDHYQPDTTATLHHEFLELSTIWPCSPAHQYLGI